ncbi:prephenate dehydratase [bacterium]|nr:prephenate dehydratase [bacterium]
MTARKQPDVSRSLRANEKRLRALLDERAALVSRKTRGRSPRTFPRETAEMLLREVRAATRALESPLSVAYMGPPSSFSHQAAMKHFGSAPLFHAKDSIADVFRSVVRGETGYGVVPVENTIEGAVTYTLDMLVDTPVQICNEVRLEIHMNLMSTAAAGDITTIYSIPIAFAQCRNWLSKHFPHARQADVYSTARAAELAAQEPNAAAVASELAAKLYGLNIIGRAIEDHLNNTTRFFVIGLHAAPPSEHDKTSIVFAIKDRVGALYDALRPFRSARINLSKIESRPMKQKAWEYYFFVDLVGHASRPDVRRALDELQKHCTFVKILGSYPQCER